jgi:phytoene synthase
MPVTTTPPVPRPGSSLQLALMAAGPHRQALTAWVRWWHEVSDIPYSVSDPSVADRKLAWWGQAVADAFQSPPQHPLLQAMTRPGIPLTEPPLALWLEQIEGLRTLTQQTRWLDDAPLERHAWATTGAAAEGLVWLMGAREPQVLSLARRLGVGLRRAHILARLGQDAQQGWLHIPIDTLQAHDVKAHELLKPAPGPAKDEIRQLLSFWHQRCAQDLQNALSEAQALPAEQRRALKPLVVLSRLNLALMDDLSKAAYAVLRQRILLGPWRKLWLGWRAQWF